MKLTLAILACVAVVGLQAAYVPKDSTNVENKALMEMQKFIYEILYRVEDPLQFEEYIKLGSALVVDPSKYLKYDKTMTKFYNSYKAGALLPKAQYFSAVKKEHSLQALGLFNFFFYAKDSATLVQNIAWARMNVNPGMFVYALNLAAMHRVDMQQLAMPSIFEIFPQMFLNSRSVYQAEKFDSDIFNRQMMLDKELASQSVAESSNFFYMKDWKTWQWWKLMGLEEKFHVADKCFLRNDMKTLENPELLKDLDVYYLPVDYTRDIEMMNADSKLSYYTEDVGLNGFWYNFNLAYSELINGQDLNMNNSRRGETWIYAVQQLLARYNMERLSHGLGQNEDLSMYGIVKTGYDPKLIAYNGNGFTYRKNNYNMDSFDRINEALRFVAFYRHVTDIVDSGKYVTSEGVEIDLSKPEAIDQIGSLMQGNIDVMDKNFFGKFYALANLYFGAGQAQPHVLQNYETMLRDPITYPIFRRIMQVYYKFKNQLPAYSREELTLPGVVIDDVVVSELKTFFDLYDHDITNLLNSKLKFVDGKFIWDKVLLARQQRLNNMPFNYNIKVKSDKAQKVYVRTFMAPEFDQYEKKIELLSNRENFVEIDAFYYDLPAGKSSIKRSSSEFSFFNKDTVSYTEMYKQMMLSSYENKKDMSMRPAVMFPERLLLPRGWVKGMPVRLFTMISPADSMENRPMGYPFDRKINNYKDFVMPNMFMKHVKIYHEDKLDKYYPMKYDNFGNFDYNY